MTLHFPLLRVVIQRIPGFYRRALQLANLRADSNHRNDGKRANIANIKEPLGRNKADLRGPPRFTRGSSGRAGMFVSQFANLWRTRFRSTFRASRAVLSSSVSAPSSGGGLQVAQRIQLSGSHAGLHHRDVGKNSE